VVYSIVEYVWPQNIWVTRAILLIGIFLIAFFLQFFRNPARYTQAEDGMVIAPADGKVVIVETKEEVEVFQDQRIQVSIFMSPLNVHVNRYPVSGVVSYSRYHKGKYLVAWHPKSSLLNERTTVVVDTPKYGSILYRQIAGALARRIINYAKPQMRVSVGDDSGFIRFGSRVDVFLPTDAEVLVTEDQVVKGGETVIASLKRRENS
jgi:phosphatidylserine decarboxylase